VESCRRDPSSTTLVASTSTSTPNATAKGRRSDDRNAQ
jgi:hypothetical protein